MWRLIRSFMLLTGVIFVGTGTLVGAAQLVTRDFLAAYRGMMPGETVDGTETERCRLRLGTSNGIETGFCQFEAGDDVFGRVTVVETDRVIQRLAFEVQPDALHLGDLVLCWGDPTQQESVPFDAEGTQTTTRWDDRVYIGHSFVRGSEPVNYFMPVNYLSLEGEGLVCASGE
jgi:hypothetical protein